MNEDTILKDFWLDDYRRELLQTAIGFCKRSPKSMEKYAAEILGLAAIYQPKEGKIRRFLDAQQLKKLQFPHQLAGLLLVALNVLANREEAHAERDPEELGILRQLRAENRKLCEKLPESYPGHKYNDEGTVRKSESLVDNLIALMALEFELRAEDFVAAGSYFFPDFDRNNLPKESLRQYYKMYRFYSTPGKIAKSFTVVASPTTKVGACVFANFFISPNRKTPRKTTGIIVPTKQAFYFVGGIAEGTGLKFMAAERLQSPPPVLRGLVTTFDDNVIVAGRFVMHPTKVPTHTEAKIGVFSFRTIKREVRDIVDQLRNRVGYKLEKPLKLNGKPIAQEDLITKTSVAFDKAFGAQVVSQDGQSFNTASLKDYPYNSALTIWNERENP